MKVCLISFEYPPNSLIMGGAGTYASLLVKGLEDRGVSVYTLTSGNKTVHDWKTYRIAIPNMTYLRRLFFSKSADDLLYYLNRKIKFDLVHFNEPHIITGRPKLPIVCTFHSTQLNELKSNLKERNLITLKNIRDLVMKNPVGHFLDIITGLMADRIICPSPNLVKLLKYCFVDEQKIQVIPNGIDLEAFDKINHDTAYMSKEFLEEESYLLFVGRLHHLKGVHYLVKAFKRIKKNYRKMKLVIVGSGDFEPQLRKIARGTKDIFFAGYVNSTKTKKLLYENCLTVVLPSIYETFPMVALEAMACGKPVISSNVGGVPLLIRHGKNGFLVKPGDVRGLENFICTLCGDRSLTKRMGMFGRRMVEKYFTLDKMVDKTLKVYESLL